MSILDKIADALGAGNYYAHSICLTNDPLIMAAYVGGDTVTFLSYMVIGITLLTRRVPVLAQRDLTILYGAFIFLCGFSHLTKTLTLFTGIYRLDVLVVAAMASVSAVTAIFTIGDVLRVRAAGA